MERNAGQKLDQKENATAQELTGSGVTENFGRRKLIRLFAGAAEN